MKRIPHRYFKTCEERYDEDVRKNYPHRFSKPVRYKIE